MIQLRLLLWVVAAVLLGALACGDDDGGSVGGVDGGVDGGPPGTCPFRPLIDQCLIREAQPTAGQCLAGEGCYWLSFPCTVNTDCREGTVCQDGVCQEDLDMDGELEPAAQAFCQTVAENGAVGDACESFNECADGLTCDRAECVPYCCDRADCGVTELCFFNVEQRADALGGRIGTCRECRGCSLAPNDGCLAGEGCYLFDECAVCLQAGTLADGDECRAANDCAPGSVCVRPSPTADFRCERFCVAGTVDCDPGDVCRTGLVESDPTLGTCVPES